MVSQQKWNYGVTPQKVLDFWMDVCAEGRGKEEGERVCRKRIEFGIISEIFRRF
jgi:hypothetical protein